MYDLTGGMPIFPQPQALPEVGKPIEQKDEESGGDGEGGWGDFDQGPGMGSSRPSEPKEKDSDGEDIFAAAFSEARKLLILITSLPIKPTSPEM